MQRVETKKIALTEGPLGLAVSGRSILEEPFTRVTNAPLIKNNSVRLLRDAAENYPAWLDAIGNAKDRIFFESYIIHEDEQGKRFSDALIAKARDGVDVKVIYDWMGGFGKTSRGFWKRLKKNGVEVRCYNAPNFMDPLGIFSRDHRKSLVVDGTVGFVSGLCVGRDWAGDESRGISPWRDTGLEIIGPAVADVEAAFAQVWAAAGGPPLDSAKLASRGDIPPSGSVPIRIVQSLPSTAYIYRLDQLLASFAKETMWITDAYFVGTPSFLQGLKDASRDGVDVRVLVPQTSDIGLIRDTTRSTYRPLLEAGVRLYEWNGPMLHAKTAVFDGKVSRIGSTNLNIASWFGNYELDVIVEDEKFGELMEDMFLEDLENATEIVLDDTSRINVKKLPRRKRQRRGSGSVRKTTAGALNAATSIGSAITKKTPLGAAESRLLFMVGSGLLGLALLMVKFPRGTTIPFIVILLILAVPTFVKAIQSYKNG